VPSYSSVFAITTVVLPPNAKPAVCVPHPANAYLAVPKFPPAVQLVPSYSSVAFVVGLPPDINPPNAKPTVCVPAPARLDLAVAKFPPAVQLVPSYSSVFATTAVV
jgi:hypothetical protein